MLKVLRKKNQVVVSGVNLKFKRVQDDEMVQRTKTLQKEHPIHVSNVALIDPELNVPTRIRTGYLEDGRKVKHYYPTESTGLATGMLITALHLAGLATLTHTPSPMKFLNEILDRPTSERPFLLLVVGYPADDARVPDIGRKDLAEFTTFIDEQA